MSEDRDDTVLVPPRAPAEPAAPDTDDTVIRGSREPAVLDTLALETTTVETVGELPSAPTTASKRARVAPSYYRFRLGEREDSIPLDVPCYIGRRPSPPRVIVGRAPRLVRVPSPSREVSATHVELRQLGSSVIVTDLRSTNGSIVMLPGSTPRKLLQGESVVVSPGTLVDIGDDNILQILPMQRPS